MTVRTCSRSTRAVLACVAGVAVLLLAGCSSSPGVGTPSAPGPFAAEGSQAVGLLNLWRVNGAAGESANTWLRIDVAEFQLWRECGMISGSWAATDTLFLGGVTGASDTCVSAGAMPTIDWLDAVTSYRSMPGGWVLRSRDGQQVATLTLDGAPQPIDSAADFYTQPPVVTDAVRQALRPPAALPAMLKPATAALLQGTWVPASGAQPTNPNVTFDASGTWTGSDGCNAASGRWVIGDGGRLLTTSGVSTLIGCDGAPVPTWVANAKRAGIDGNTLVLLGRDGAELGRLARG